MKKLILLLTIISLFSFSLVTAKSFNLGTSFIDDYRNSEFSLEKIGVANPAAIYCKDLGYEYKINKTSEGEMGICMLPDKECEEWKFIQGKCGQEYSYCAKQGYDLITKADGNNPFSYEYAVCVDKISKKEVGSVTELFSLDEKTTIGDFTTQENSNAIETQETTSTDGLVSIMQVPTSFDWRNKDGQNWMSPVKDQGACGSCWAFSAAGVVEAIYNIKECNCPNLDLDLSEEYLVSTCSNAGDCGGGSHRAALTFIRNNGIPDEGCFPYTAANAPCTDRCADWQNRLIRVSETGNVANNRTLIQERLVNTGPLSVSMGIDNPGDGFDGNHIYRCANDALINHAVIIAGYNDAGGHWIVKNSWGSGWETNGYFNVGYGECGIETVVDYVSETPRQHSKTSVIECAGDCRNKGTSNQICANTYGSSWHATNVDCEAIEVLNANKDWERTFGSTLDWCNDGGGEDMTITCTDQPTGNNRVVAIECRGSCSDEGTPNYICQSKWDTSESDVATFYSPACSSGHPIACLSESATVDQSHYGEDDILTMKTDGSACKVVADDSVDVFEQKRQNGVVCSDIQTNEYWSDWQTSGSDVATFYSPACSSGHPIACLSESATSESEPNYGEDHIQNMITESSKCKVVADDVVGGFEHKRKVGVVCSSVQTNEYWSDWQTSGSDVATFYSPDCSSGHPIACLSESATSESEPNYGEDDIQNMVIEGSKCKVTADDTVGGFEHKRKVGVVCSDAQTTIKWSDYGSNWHATGVDCEGIEIPGANQNWDRNFDSSIDWCSETGGEDMTVTCSDAPAESYNVRVLECNGDCRRIDRSPDRTCQDAYGAGWLAKSVDCEFINIDKVPDGTYTRYLSEVWYPNSEVGWCEDSGGEDMTVTCVNCNAKDGWYCILAGTKREYRDYSPTNGTCEYTVTQTQTCSDLNYNYCDGDKVKYVGYVCIDGTCQGSVVGEEDCNVRDNWYNVGSSYSCCDGGLGCTCQNQEYRNYYCSGGSCAYTVTNTQTVKSGCTCTETCCDAQYGTPDAYCSGGTCYPPCTPGSDIIIRTNYADGICEFDSDKEWSHSTCGSTKVCNQYACKLVDADITSFTMPSGTYARSDTISIPYTVKNVGETQWCFLAESDVIKSNGTHAYPSKWNSVSPSASASDTITYQVGCSDPTGTWSANLGSYTDGYSVGGWNVWYQSSQSFQVVQCLNDADCSTCLGSCYYCNSGTKACYYGCGGGGPMFYKV